MKKLLSAVCSVVVCVLPCAAWGNVSAAVKVECMGNCDSITLSQACQAGWSGAVPYAISCDHPSGGQYDGQYWCGSANAFCENISISSSRTVGAYCEDGDGNDAVVMCSDGAPSPLAAVKVECQGPCDTVTMQDICGPLGMSAVSVSCADTAEGRGTNRACGNGATCRDWGQLDPGDPLGAYCQDGAGYDAIVTCGPPSGTRAVKVECWGSGCTNVTLGEVCNLPEQPDLQFAVPFQISCDDTATPGNGTVHSPCQSSGGGSTCTTWGGAWYGDPLGAYCGDGDGFDAVVTCP